MIKLSIFFGTLIFIGTVQSQNVGIGTTTPASSAQLDVSSTTKGFLPPRMTFDQRNAIQNPSVGLVIWCIDCDELQVYNGTIWKNMSGAAGANPTLPNVKICDQVWMVNNLDVTTYRNGQTIPQVTDPAVWASLTIGAWCWYNNDSATYAATYGRLYNQNAIIDVRGIVPEGWHIPSESEWNTLTACLGGVAVAGGKMKETGTMHWLDPNTGATNLSGFSGLPGGYRQLDGSFNNQGQYSGWWSSTFSSGQFYYARFLRNNTISIPIATSNKLYGLSIRCVRD